MKAHKFHIINFYQSKNLKKMIAIPLLMVVVSLYFSTHLVLDTSLRGGISITFPINSTVNITAIRDGVSAGLNIPFSLITINPGGGGLTIPANQSVANGETALTNFYIAKSNYTSYNFNVTAVQIQLSRDSNNQTLQSQLATLSASANVSLSQMRTSLQNELSALSVLITKPSYDPTSASNMSNVADAAYATASSAYQNKVASVMSTVAPGMSYSYEEITPTLGKYFLQQVMWIIITAFILISIAVFFIFRSPVPSFAVVFDAANDIIIAIGLMGVFQIPLGLASLGGLLMLIGYSIDTAILTSIRILKRHESSVEERAYSAMLTGVTMTGTAIVSFSVLFIISIVSSIPTFYQISSVALFGLVADIFTTWFGDAPMVMLYKKSKERG